MDRFNSDEDAQDWDSTAWRSGYAARMGDKVMDPPAKLTGWRKKSWVAGWTDADATVQAERTTAE